MLAKFENGYFLEVLVDEVDNEYEYTVYDKEGYETEFSWTEYRDIEMYYPKTLIDYILEFCEPSDVEGKYEILKQKNMDEYLDLFGEDPNGKWILERQGEEDDIRRYSTLDAAKLVTKKEYEETLEDYEPCMHKSLEENCASIGAENYYQSWNIYEEKDNLSELEKVFDEINLELDRIYTGVEQYAFELQDTSVITEHIYKLKEMIEGLKEMM